MSGGVHEVAEHIEHAAHAGHGDHGGGKSISKFIGLTMATLGVLLALCSALVGSERTQLVRVMVEQSNTYAEFQAASSKYRILMTQLEQTYAVTPSRALTKEIDGKLQEFPIPADQAASATLQREVFKSLSTLLTPRKSEIEHLLGEVNRYNEERKAASTWAASYDDEVQAHAEAAEEFEKAQLIAEVGIVIASIALLLSSRPLWIVALVGLVGSGGMAGKTYLHTRGEVHEAHEKIEHAKERYKELHDKKDASGVRLAEMRDDETRAKIRERFGIAAPVKPEEPEHKEPEHKEPEHKEPEHAP